MQERHSNAPRRPRAGFSRRVLLILALLLVSAQGLVDYRDVVAYRQQPGRRAHRLALALSLQLPGSGLTLLGYVVLRSCS